MILGGNMEVNFGQCLDLWVETFEGKNQVYNGAFH